MNHQNYYQNINGLYKTSNIGNVPSKRGVMRIGNKFFNRKDVVLVKIVKPLDFFRRVSRNYVKNRIFSSFKNFNKYNRQVHFLVFNPKNYRNVIEYYKIKNHVPTGTLNSNNNGKFKHTVSAAKKIQNKFREYKRKRFIKSRRLVAQAA